VEPGLVTAFKSRPGNNSHRLPVLVFLACTAHCDTVGLLEVGGGVVDSSYFRPSAAALCIHTIHIDLFRVERSGQRGP
jgi:hypothetical protein